jgi:hypothetical protein
MSAFALTPKTETARMNYRESHIRPELLEQGGEVILLHGRRECREFTNAATPVSDGGNGTFRRRADGGSSAGQRLFLLPPPPRGEDCLHS